MDGMQWTMIIEGKLNSRCMGFHHLNKSIIVSHQQSLLVTKIKCISFHIAAATEKEMGGIHACYACFLHCKHLVLSVCCFCCCWISHYHSAKNLHFWVVDCLFFIFIYSCCHFCMNRRSTASQHCCVSFWRIWSVLIIAIHLSIIIIMQWL